MCSNCGRVLPGWYPRPVNPMYDRPVTKDQVWESSVQGVALVARPLLARVLPLLLNVVVGKALDKEGREIPSHYTIYAKDYIDPRAGLASEVWVCEGCGVVRSPPSNDEPEYLLNYQLNGRHAFLDRIGRLFVSEDKLGPLDLRQFPTMTWQEMHILSYPRDGLRFPYDPPEVRGRDATVNWNRPPR